MIDRSFFNAMYHINPESWVVSIINARNHKCIIVEGIHENEKNPFIEILNFRFDEQHIMEISSISHSSFLQGSKNLCNKYDEKIITYLCTSNKVEEMIKYFKSKEPEIIKELEINDQWFKKTLDILQIDEHPLYKKESLNANNDLLEATKKDKLLDIERALARGANVNTRCGRSIYWHSNFTPLMIAVTNRSIDATEFLVKNKANVNLMTEPYSFSIFSPNFNIMDLAITGYLSESNDELKSKLHKIINMLYQNNALPRHFDKSKLKDIVVFDEKNVKNDM